MIDKDGFRLNVGIIIINKQGKLFWGKRAKSHGWQFPQGGVNSYETLKETMYRELAEEVGLEKQDVKILSITKRWLRYKLPVRMRRKTSLPVCIGQKQKWFLLLLTSEDNKINLKKTQKPEFLSWSWIDYWDPLKNVIFFKKEIYSKVLQEFEPIVKKTTRDLKID